MSTAAPASATSGSLPLPSRLKPALPALGVATLLAAGSDAYAQIVYSGALNGGSGISIAANTLYGIDVDGIGGVDLTLKAVGFGGEGGYLQLLASGSGLGVASGGYVAKLSGADTISSGSTFLTGNTFIWGSSILSTPWGPSSQFTTDLRGYIGFEFTPGGTNYGWLDIGITTADGGTPPTMKLYGYAYESSAGAAITAGAIPEPAPAALVIGAAALLAFRQRRRKAA
jgi:hypothetical protein